ncbi:MAG: fimbrial protein, partial [Lysobacter sp.]
MPMKSSGSSRRPRLYAVVALGLLPAALLLAPTASADCGVVWYFQAQDVQMDMGQVVIPSGLPVGAVIKEIQVPISPRNRAIYCDKKSTGSARGEYVQLEQSGGSTGDNVHPTKVAGVGIRVWREGESVRTYYPHNLPLAGGQHGQWYSLEGGSFIVELVKTAPVTGSGPIANNGRFTTYYVGNQSGRPVLTSTFKGSGTTIVQPTC